MKRNIAIILCLSAFHFIHAQGLNNAISEIQNENLIKAKQELLSIYKTDNSSITAFYIASVYLKLGVNDSAYYFLKNAELGESAFSYLAKARAAQLNGQDTNAVRYFIDKAISVSKGRDAEVFFQAGNLAYQPKPINVKAYLRYTEKAGKMEPSNKYYALTLGDMYLDMNAGMGGDAMSIYEDVLSRDTNYVLANIRIGRLYYSAKNYGLAIKYLEKANAVDPKYSIAHKELGELYYLTRNYEKAADEFKKYIDLNYNDSRAKATYGGFLFQLKEYQKAIDIMSTYMQTDSNNYIYLRIMAYSQFECKKTKDAQVTMNKFWKIVQSAKISGMDYSYAGKIAAANGDTANAIKYFKTSVNIDSSNADLQSEYGKALFNAKRNKEAIVQFNKRMQMEKFPGSLDYYYLGRAYYSNGEYVNADSNFAEFIRMQPKSPDGYLWRAKCNLELEDKANLKGYSIEHYLKYIELASSDLARNKSNLISAYNYLAYVALSSGDKEKAKGYFSKIVEIDPENKNAVDELSKLKK